MKLKKIASLMLVGVMAVSMLAGCSTGTKPDDGEKDPVVDSSLTGKVIAALDEDTTKNIDFSANASLQAALEKVVKNKGTAISGIKLEDLSKIDPDLVGDGSLNGVYGAGNEGHKWAAESDSKTDDVSFVISRGLTAGADEEYIANEIAKAIDDNIANWKLSEPSKSITYTFEQKDFHYDFEYTGDVAVAKVTDAVSGVTSYVAVYTITRTATKVVE